MSIEEGLRQIDLDPDEYDVTEVEAELHETERCCTCSWWFEAFEMKDNGECENCNPDEDEE